MLVRLWLTVWVLVPVLSGCTGPSGDAGDEVSAIAFSDFHGCQIEFPDGSPAPCGGETVGKPVPPRELGLCVQEGSSNGQWVAAMTWPGGAFGLAAELTKGHSAVLIVQTDAGPKTLRLDTSGAVGMDLAAHSPAVGWIVTFSANATLTHNDHDVPVVSHWSTWKDRPWASYEAKEHWFVHWTRHRLGDSEFIGTSLDFHITGLDFELQVRYLHFADYAFATPASGLGLRCRGP